MEKINNAVRIHSYGGPQAVRMDQVEIPAPAQGKVLLEVRAAGINAIDRKIREGRLKEVFKLPLPATLGVELAGTVIAAGAGVGTFAVGARVFGPVLSLGNVQAGHRLSSLGRRTGQSRP